MDSPNLPARLTVLDHALHDGTADKPGKLMAWALVWPGASEADRDALARRLAACYNACAGLSVAEIEATAAVLLRQGR